MRLLILSFSIFLIACNNGQPKVLDANKAFYDSIKNFTGIEFDERLKSADSLKFNFYDNPDGDAKRYTRFYAEYSTVDTLAIRVIAEATNKKFTRLEQIKDCRSQGKIFLFEDSKPKQTIYFSNRGDSCNHLYFIKDGWFYYMNMDTATANLLTSLKAKATKPVGETLSGE